MTGILTLLSFLHILYSAEVLAKSGDLDPTFGTNGIVATHLGDYSDVASGVVIQPDGKIVVAGGTTFITRNDRHVVIRYNADGSLDSTFGSGGVVTTEICLYTQDARTLVLQDDGKIVTAGYAKCSSNYYDLFLSRHHTDGSLDTSFNGGGTILLQLGDDARLNSLAVLPDGKLIGAGSCDDCVEGKDECSTILTRFNIDGSLDTDFDKDGLVFTLLPGCHNAGNAVAIQTDGKMIVAGNIKCFSPKSNTMLLLLRYNEDGTLDTGFGTDGVVSTEIDNTAMAKSVAVQPDGKIVAAGYATDDLTDKSKEYAVVVRYESSGGLDTTFGTSGIVTLPKQMSHCNAVAVQSDGKIILGGYIYTGVKYFALARLLPDGSLDHTFGSGGIVTTEFYNAGVALDLEVYENGNIILVGMTYNHNGTGWDFTTARFLGDISPSIATADVSSITKDTAMCGGNISSDGGSQVSARGVCWSTSPNTTISDSHTTDSAGIGGFTSSLTGLAPETTYYVRAYATNEKGTNYGLERTFTTLAEGDEEENGGGCFVLSIDQPAE